MIDFEKLTPILIIFGIGCVLFTIICYYLIKIGLKRSRAITIVSVMTFALFAMTFHFFVIDIDETLFTSSFLLQFFVSPFFPIILCFLLIAGTKKIKWRILWFVAIPSVLSYISFAVWLDENPFDPTSWGHGGFLPMCYMILIFLWSIVYVLISMVYLTVKNKKITEGGDDES